MLGENSGTPLDVSGEITAEQLDSNSEELGTEGYPILLSEVIGKDFHVAIHLKEEPEIKVIRLCLNKIKVAAYKGEELFSEEVTLTFDPFYVSFEWLGLSYRNFMHIGVNFFDEMVDKIAEDMDGDIYLKVSAIQTVEGEDVLVKEFKNINLIQARKGYGLVLSWEIGL